MAGQSDHSESDPDGEIMHATRRALRKHGYAELTMQRIADECGKSTAALHYHYETKEALLAAFLDHLLGRFKEGVHEVETTEPEARLELLLDKLLVNAEDHQELLVAVLGMRSQAPYKKAFAERFEANDEYVRYLLETVIEQGIEAGVFTDTDPEHAAGALMTIVDGGRTRAVVFDESDALETARRTAAEYVDNVLSADR